MVWHVDKYKITLKLIISHWTNEILQHIVISSGLSRPGKIDARTRYRDAARRLRNTAVFYLSPPRLYVTPFFLIQSTQMISIFLQQHISKLPRYF